MGGHCALVRFAACLPNTRDGCRLARDCCGRVSAWAHACASVTDVSVVVRQACEDVLSTPVGTLAVYLERQASAQRMPPLELIRAITARMGEGNQIVRACPEVFCYLARLLLTK